MESSKKTTLYFYVTDQVHLLDLGGVLHVFQEAIDLGFPYQLEFISSSQKIKSSAGLWLSGIKLFTEVSLTQNDFIFIPGFSSHDTEFSFPTTAFNDWLIAKHNLGCTICSICSGAFILANSGILNHLQCTTHWSLIDRLKKEHPTLHVKKDVLFTEENRIYTSAGIVTGIDLALYLIEKRHGKEVAIKIAKELVVYKRRKGTESQESVYLQHRNHIDEKIHMVQDWIIHNLEKTATINDLAALVNISPRNLTRIFKKQTGTTIAAYRTKIRVEKAKSLLIHSDHKIAYIATLCGFKTTKQLQHILKNHL